MNPDENYVGLTTVIALVIIGLLCVFGILTPFLVIKYLPALSAERSGFVSAIQLWHHPPN
jgi:hypothetical protein